MLDFVVVIIVTAEKISMMRIIMKKMLINVSGEPDAIIGCFIYSGFDVVMVSKAAAAIGG